MNVERKLAVDWVKFNQWEWPEGYGEEEPRDAPRPNRRSEYMKQISDKIGIKACLRQWNADRMSDEEFEEFWKRRQA